MVKSLLQHVNQLTLHGVVNGTVTLESTALWRVSREGGNQSLVFHLGIEVADESLACRVGGCHIAEHPLFGLSGKRIEHSDHTVYSGKVKHKLDVHVVLSLADDREQTWRDVAVSCQYLLGGVAQGHTHKLGIAVVQVLARNIFQPSVNDVTACQIEQVAHPATDKALEDKHVLYKRGMVAASVPALIDLVAFFDCQIVGITIDMTVGLHLTERPSSE